MSTFPKFDPKELEVIGEVPQMFGPPVEALNTPITPRENTLRLYQGKTPLWAPFSSGDTTMLTCDVDPEMIARRPGGGIDGYGVEWEYVDEVGGAMVRPGAPKCPDINEWEKYLTIPDPDTWDWEGFAERAKEKMSPDRATYVAVPGCLFERLIAVLDMSNALVALIDEDEQEAVHRFFRQVTNVHKKFYTNCKKYLNADIVNWNDDWGSQRAEFFSVDTVREMLLPYVKELTEHVHSLGMYWDTHCCGYVRHFVPLFIEAGMDSWGGQALNDKWDLKQTYGDQFIFTEGPRVSPDATEEEMDAAVEKFMNECGRDNRILVELMGCPPVMRKKIYEASRRNFDRMVAEGTAIL